MAITVEDGTIVAGANSYVSSAQIEEFADLRGVSLTTDAEQLAILSMDYIESRSFYGQKATEAQGTQFPRSGLVIDGFEISSSIIPVELTKAQMMVALEIDAGNNPLAPIEAAVKREKVGSLEVEYKDTGNSSTITPAITAMLRKLTGNSGGNTVDVGRI